MNCIPIRLQILCLSTILDCINVLDSDLAAGNGTSLSAPYYRSIVLCIAGKSGLNSGYPDFWRNYRVDHYYDVNPTTGRFVYPGMDDPYHPIEIYCTETWCCRSTYIAPVPANFPNTRGFLYVLGACLCPGFGRLVRWIGSSWNPI